MDQQHPTSQARRCGHFLLEVEQDVAWVGRIEILHLVAEHELILEVHQAVRAIRLRRGLGHQARHTAATITGDVVPDHLDTAFRNGERDRRLEVFQAVAAADQVGPGGVFLDGREHIVRHGRAAMGRINRHLEGVWIAFDHRVLAGRQLVLVLLDVLRGDGEQRFLAGIRVGQEALAVHCAGILRHRCPGRNGTGRVTGLFRAHWSQGGAQLGGFIGRHRGHHAARQQRQSE